jgi:cytochrome o ubiquinol oxidase operon protein cyoD
MKTRDISSFGVGHLSTYVIGFGLSIVLTIIPFTLVMNHYNIIRSTILITIVLLAIVQAIVHLRCFLHLKPASDQSWNWLSFVYTLILLLALVGGSAWIIYHLNNNMMPMQNMTTTQQMR